jgi:hypothetical protein
MSTYVVDVGGIYVTDDLKVVVSGVILRIEVVQRWCQAGQLLSNGAICERRQRAS